MAEPGADDRRGRLEPVVGLLIAAVAVEEGSEAWRGEGCCVSSPLDGAGFDCAAGCCTR